jgi:hypothetical protein
MESQLNPVEKLDMVLSALMTSTKRQIYYVNFREQFGNLETKEFVEIILKLEKDELIIKHEVQLGPQTADILQTTFDGRLFYMNGGYEKKKQVEDANFIVLQNNAHKADAYAKRLLLATIIAAGVGLLVLFWYIFVWFCPHPADCFCTK